MAISVEMTNINKEERISFVLDSSFILFFFTTA